MASTFALKWLCFPLSRGIIITENVRITYRLLDCLLWCHENIFNRDFNLLSNTLRVWMEKPRWSCKLNLKCDWSEVRHFDGNACWAEYCSDVRYRLPRRWLNDTWMETLKRLIGNFLQLKNVNGGKISLKVFTTFFTNLKRSTKWKLHSGAKVFETKARTVRLLNRK
jgi:hypothetical protein